MLTCDICGEEFEEHESAHCFYGEDEMLVCPNCYAATYYDDFDYGQGLEDELYEIGDNL